MVELSDKLGMEVRDAITKYRQKNNIPEPEELKTVYNKNMVFLEEELSLVREITIDKKSVEYIDLFPNVTSLIIDGKNELEQEDIQKVVTAFPKLENLSIIGQDKLQYLDVSSLIKLRDLELISNRGLHKLAGVDKLNELSNFVFYDNQIYTAIPELCDSVIEMTKKDVQCDLDILYMPNMLQKKVPFDTSNIKWSEEISIGRYGNKLQYDTKELQEAVAKAKEIVSSHIKPTDTPIQKYAILYQWMCENIRYDYEALDNNYIHSSDGKEQGLVGGTNGTVNGLVYGHCVCEGYSKSMQMLLKMCDIPAFEIGCMTGEKHMDTPMFYINDKKIISIGNHSILKVNLDGKIYYSDVTWDANRFQNNREIKYFLLSNDDMQKDHKLLGEENVVSMFKSLSQEEQAELFDFAKNRVSAVKEEKKTQNNKPKENTEIIANVNKDLIAKRQSYNVVATQIEEIMIQNQKSPLPNYEQRLALLIQQKDNIFENITQLMSYQSTLQYHINYDKEKKLNALISQVERSLGINILATDCYTANLEKSDGVPQIILKNTTELIKEQGTIIQQLNDLWFDGELDLKKSKELKNAVREKYQQMISVAPKPPKNETTHTQSQEVQSMSNEELKRLNDLRQQLVDSKNIAKQDLENNHGMKM